MKAIGEVGWNQPLVRTGLDWEDDVGFVGFVLHCSRWFMILGPSRAEKFWWTSSSSSSTAHPPRMEVCDD